MLECGQKVVIETDKLAWFGAHKGDLGIIKTVSPTVVWISLLGRGDFPFYHHEVRIDYRG